MTILLRLLVAGVVLFGIGALSRAPFHAHARESALLRLSWRIRGEPVQSCRNRTQEELAALPVHMRTPQVCSGRVARYRLLIAIDGNVLSVRELHAAGAHADRPIYVFEEISLNKGEHDIRVEFVNTGRAGARPLTLQQRITASEGHVLLLTYDEERGLYLVP